MTKFVVATVEIDAKTGHIIHHGVSDVCDTAEDAQHKMRAAYGKKLNLRGLPDNGTSDEDGNSAPGGYITADEAGIYEYADFAFGQLLQTVAFSIQVVSIPNAPVKVGSYVFAVSRKIKANSLGRYYRTHEYELVDGEVLSVKYEADDAVSVEVFANRNVQTSFGTLCNPSLESYKYGEEAFCDYEAAKRALAQKKLHESEHLE